MTRSDSHTIVVEKDGYVSARRELRPGWNPWQLGNIVLGGLIGTAIDFVDGSFIWLGGPVKMQLARVPSPGMAEPGVASARGGAGTTVRQRRASPPPVMADAAPARRSAPAAASDATDYQPTRLPPRRQSAPAQ
jgi:hypothetical protein